MLQIIGWIGCLYLLVKGLEILGNAQRIKAERPEEPHPWPTVLAVVLAILGAIVFPYVLYLQVNEAQSMMQPASAYSDCVSHSSTIEEMNKCKP